LYFHYLCKVFNRSAWVGNILDCVKKVNIAYHRGVLARAAKLGEQATQTRKARSVKNGPCRDPSQNSAALRDVSVREPARWTKHRPLGDDRCATRRLVPRALRSAHLVLRQKPSKPCSHEHSTKGSANPSAQTRLASSHINPSTDQGKLGEQAAHLEPRRPILYTPLTRVFAILLFDAFSQSKTLDASPTFALGGANVGPTTAVPGEGRRFVGDACQS
jgi:hypothetical protein